MALLRLGALHGRFEAFAEAEEALRDALELGTEDALPRIHLATLFLRRERPEEAVEVLLPLQTERPDSLVVNALLARGYLALGEATKGRRLAGEVAERSPELARRYGLGPGSGALRGSDDFDPALFPLPSAEEELEL
jgi:predicted Zn-dependent protease